MADSRQFVKIIVGVFVIFIVLRITEFLRTLPQCPCVAEKSGKSNNLDKIVFLEYSVIFIAVVKIIHTIYNMYVGAGKESKDSPYMLFMVFLSTVIYTFFIYNVYEHQQSAGSKCECADKWQQSVMYFQALIYALVVAMIFFLGLITLSTGSIGDSNAKRIIVLLAVFITGLGIFSFFGGDMNIFVEHVMVYFKGSEGFELYQRDAVLESFEGIVPGLDTRKIPRESFRSTSRNAMKTSKSGTRSGNQTKAIKPVKNQIVSSRHR